MKVSKLPLRQVHVSSAVARNMSFTNAASDLNISLGTVSGHVQRLETFLGVKLFHRDRRSISLTPAGERIFPTIEYAFAEIAETLQRELDNQAFSAGEVRPYTVSAPANIATRIIAPAIVKKKLLSEVDFEVSLDGWVDEKAAKNSEITIRYARDTPSEGLLFEESALPVCSPELLAGPVSPDELLKRPLIKATPDNFDWKLWSKATGVTWKEPSDMTSVQTDADAIQHATIGMGICLAELRFVGDLLESGHLVRACDCEPVKIGCLTYDIDTYRPMANQIIDWITDEADAALSRAINALG